MTNDRPLTSFANEDDAYDYAVENKACVYGDFLGDCVFCKRWDH